VTTGKETQMAEIRFEVPRDDLAVLDAYVQHTGGSRTGVMLDLLRSWASGKVQESRMILNVLPRNPSAVESVRSRSGSES